MMFLQRWVTEDDYDKVGEMESTLKDLELVTLMLYALISLRAYLAGRKPQSADVSDSKYTCSSLAQ